MAGNRTDEEDGWGWPFGFLSEWNEATSQQLVALFP